MIDEAVYTHTSTNTHLLTQEFEYVEPASLQEAIALLSQYGDRAQVLAGGTYLLVQMKMESITPPACLINIRNVPGLEGVTFGDGEAAARSGARIGANTTIRALRDMPGIQADYTALAEACAAFGSVQIEMMGTLGGNVCNGSPASDTVPALLALDAHLMLAGPEGERVLPLHEFLVGPGQTALRKHELVVAVVLPKLPAQTGSAFIKLSRVVADLAKVSAAAVLTRDGERIVDCRLSFGSVAPTVMRTRRAEALLIGKTFSPELALEAGRIASEEISPIDDVRSTAWYRREVAGAIAHDVLQLAWQRAAQTSTAGGHPYARQTFAHGDSAHETADNVGGHPNARLGFSKRVLPDERHEIALTVNGVRRRLWVKPNDLLLNVLREDLELTGTKYGCGLGECGACTIHLNGKPALACLVLAVSADGGEVLTIEGLQGPNGELDPLQQAFIDHSAFQCGYCTPGMVMMTKSLLKENPSPTQDEIRDYLKVNRCRCTGFASILRAVMSCVEPQGNGVEQKNQEA